MRATTRLLAALAVAVGVAGPATGSAAAVAQTATPRWAAAKAATVHPGVKVVMGGVTCRAGFILTDGTHAYVAVPGWCSGAGPVDNSKCDAGQDPLGLTVTIGGAKHDGVLVYSSITTMELRGHRKTNRCAHNNLSLVRIDRRDIKRTNPSVPTLGGPSGVSSDAPAAPDQLAVYLATAANAQAINTTAGGWAHSMMVDAPVSGTDLGAPVLTSKGEAIGMVSGVPTSGGSTSVDDLHREMRYLHTLKKFADVHLAKGTVKYTPMVLQLLSA